MWQGKPEIKTRKNSNNKWFYNLYLIFYTSHNEERRKRKRSIGDQEVEPGETFFVAEIRNKKTGKIIPRTFLVSTDQYLQEFLSLLDTGKQ